MTALFRGDLIFDVNGGDAGTLVTLHGANDVDRISITGIRIGNDRNRDRIDNALRVIDHFTHAEQPDIRPAEIRCRGSETRHVYDWKTCRFNQPRAQTIVGAGRLNDL